MTHRLTVLTLIVLLGCSGLVPDIQETDKPLIFLGDPFIMSHGEKYYLYGTNARDGIEVFVSDDLKSWSGPAGAISGLALHKNDVWGERWFWAPEVYFINGTFYMYFSADEHICVATSDSPLGPFVQEIKQPMIADEKCIDNSLFIDDDGKPYLIFDRFNDGLNIWIAEMEDDLLRIRPGTMKKCINVSQPWEQVWPRVNEGSFIVKHKGLYYMTYSANSYESPYYGVGFATAEKVTGPWTKYDKNPVLQKPDSLSGVGHSAMFRDKAGQLKIVFHSHFSTKSIHPRKVHICDVSFVKDADYAYEIIKIDQSDLAPLCREATKK
jgi:beta-xylosidase